MPSVGLLMLLFSMALAMASTRNADRPELEVRLKARLTSYLSGPGTAFEAEVIAPYQAGGRVMLPAGSTVFGRVRRARTVGVGLVHERAALDLEFYQYQLPDGHRWPFRARLHSIDNARETVTGEGRIRGILAADTPQSFVHGLWHSPRPELFQHSLFGLTGASGKIWTSYSMGPIGAAALFVIRCTLFRLPEPEIQLPAGTEMKLEVSGLADNAPWLPAAAPSQVPERLAAWLEQQPFVVTKRGARLTGDLINVAFLGTREQLMRAFEAAGWSEADALTARSLSRAYKAYTAQSGYAGAPASRLIYQGAEPEFVFQKSFNTITKRHHVRIWRAEYEGREIWLGAATHDIGIVFRDGGVTHRIQARIDLERGKIVSDLAFAGCSEPSGYVDRPRAIRNPGDGLGTITDGRLALLTLQSCSVPAAAPGTPDGGGPLKSAAARMARRMVLETRQYVLRGNAYYWGYRALKWRRADNSSPELIEE